MCTCWRSKLAKALQVLSFSFPPNESGMGRGDMCSLNEVPCQRPAAPMPLNVLPFSLPRVELVAWLALRSSDQLYPPAGLASPSVGQSRVTSCQAAAGWKSRTALLNKQVKERQFPAVDEAVLQKSIWKSVLCNLEDIPQDEQCCALWQGSWASPQHWLNSKWTWKAVL